MAAVRAFAVLLAFASLACGPSDPLDRVGHPGPLTDSFAVSDEFTPSGHMGDGEEMGHILVDVDNECMVRPAGAQGKCYRFRYLPGAKSWAGVYWVYPANNWGSRPGRAIAGSRFKQVRAFVASESDSLPLSLITGGIQDASLVYYDYIRKEKLVFAAPYWQEVRLDISGQGDFDHVIGAFCWSAAFPGENDRSIPVTIYLDDIVWDTEPVPAPDGGP